MCAYPRFKQDPLPSVNPGERHVPAVLLTDISNSMEGGPIAELNQGLIDFGTALHQDSLALGRSEICVISFNSSVQTEVGFRPAKDYQAPTLSASGLTSLNEAIEKGLEEIEARKAHYKSQGMSYYRPWLFVLTDGVPTDLERESAAKAKLQNAIRNNKVVYMPMGIGNADIAKLQEYYPEETEKKIVLKASVNNFKEAFVWLSESLAVVSHSNPSVTSEVQVPPLPDNISVGII